MEVKRDFGGARGTEMLEAGHHGVEKDRSQRAEGNGCFWCWPEGLAGRSKLLEQCLRLAEEEGCGKEGIRAYARRRVLPVDRYGGL